MSEQEVKELYLQILYFIIGGMLFFISYLGLELWPDAKDQYYIEHPILVDGTLTFIAIFIMVPILSFATYLCLNAINNIVNYSWAQREIDEDTLH